MACENISNHDQFSDLHCKEITIIYSLISNCHFDSINFIAAEWLMNDLNDMLKCIFYIRIYSERQIICVKELCTEFAWNVGCYLAIYS